MKLEKMSEDELYLYMERVRQRNREIESTTFSKGKVLSVLLIFFIICLLLGVLMR